MSVAIAKGLRDVPAPPGSINAELLALPARRVDTTDMQGRLLRFPRTGIVGVPFRQHAGGWAVVVVDGSACTDADGKVTYPRGGYHIEVSDLEMLTADELGPLHREDGAGVLGPGGVLHSTAPGQPFARYERLSLRSDWIEVRP